VHDQLRAGLAVRLQGAAAPPEPLLGVIEPPDPQQRQRPGGESCHERRILAPPMRLRDPDRLLAGPERVGERQPRHQACHREVSEARKLGPRPRSATSQHQRLLEVPAGIIGPRRPQLRGTEALERDGPERVAEYVLARRLRCQRRLDQRPRLQRSLIVATPASDHEPHHREQRAKTPPTLLRDCVG
jgi:hypothetical protein